MIDILIFFFMTIIEYIFDFLMWNIWERERKTEEQFRQNDKNEKLYKTFVKRRNKKRKELNNKNFFHFHFLLLFRFV